MKRTPEAPSRDFKGIWFPRAIWLNPDLSALEKCLLAEIDSLSSESRGCWAGNAYLGKMFGAAEGSISNAIRRLVRDGYLTAEYSTDADKANGHTRWLKMIPSRKWPTDRPRPTKQPSPLGSGEAVQAGSTKQPYPLGNGNPLHSGVDCPPTTPLSPIYKKGRQAESPRESADSCNPPQPTCLPAASITKPLDDDVLEHLVCFCLAHGAIADDALAIRAEMPQLTLPFVAAWTVEFERRCKQDGKRYDNPGGWLRTGLRSGELPRTPQSAPPVAEAPVDPREMTAEKQARLNAAQARMWQEEEEEHNRRGAEAMARVDEMIRRAKAQRVSSGGIQPGGGSREAVGAGASA